MSDYFVLIFFAILATICSSEGQQYSRYRRQRSSDIDFAYDEPNGAIRNFHRVRRQLNPQIVQRFRDYGLNELEASVAADLFGNLMAALAEKMDPQMQKIVKNYVDAKNNGIPYQPMPSAVPPPLIKQSQSPSVPPQQGQPRPPQNLQQPNQPQMQYPQGGGQNAQQGQGQMRPPQLQGQQQPPQYNQQNGQQFQPQQQQQQYRPQSQVYAPPQGQQYSQGQQPRG